MKLNTLYLLVALLGFGALQTHDVAQARDFNQCKRHCIQLFGPNSQGQRINRNQCQCTDDQNQNLGIIPRKFDPAPPAPAAGFCAIDGQTYTTFQEATQNGNTVLHAGPCGACSNSHDVELYRTTRLTLNDDARACGRKYLFRGRDVSLQCMTEIGFTTPCNDCWMDNIECTMVHCRKKCLKMIIFGLPNNRRNGELNDCLQCDEDFCGKEFVRCAGVTRRRAGITSDIGRPSHQIWHPPLSPQ